MHCGAGAQFIVLQMDLAIAARLLHCVHDNEAGILVAVP